MTRWLIFAVLASLPALSTRAEGPQKPPRPGVEDYFLLLPRDTFETPPADWLMMARQDHGIDKENGYVSCGGDGAQPPFEVALFRFNDGRPLLAVCQGELEAPDSLHLKFYVLGSDGKMHQAPRSLIPIKDGSGRQFILPRRGRSVLVRSRSGSLLGKFTWNGENFVAEK